MVDAVGRLTDGAVDSAYAVAGRGERSPSTAAVNYFGAVATLEGLRPFLMTSPAPRAVAVNSMAGIFSVDDDRVEFMLAGAEPRIWRESPELPDN